MQPWVVAYTTSNRPDAQITGAILRGSGMETFIASDDAGSMAPELAFSNGVDISVRSDDLEKARKLLLENGFPD